MKAFRHVIPAMRIHQGPKALDALGAELDRVGSKRAVILCGNTLARPGSPMDKVREAMGDRLVEVYAGVKSDSPLPDVEQAAEALKRMKADAIVAVGGGSAITSARAINILLSESGHARELCTRRVASGELVSPKLLAPKLPIINIPSTPTTATVKAGSAILDTENGVRLALFDPKARASAVFLDPDIVASAPTALVVSAGLNTLALTLEALMSRRGDPLADAMLIHASRLIGKQLAAASKSDDIDVRADLMAASLLSGIGSDYTGAGMAIPIGHAIATQFDIEMGLSDSIMMPHVVRFNADHAKSGIEKIATALEAREGSNPVEAVVTALQSIYDALGLPARLRDVGVDRDSLPKLAAIAFDDWYLQSNPRPIKSVEEVEQVLEHAW